MNLIDKAAKIISPAWYYARMKGRFQAELFSSAYVGASNKRSMRNWNVLKGDANADFDITTQETLRDRCRDAYRNQTIAKACIGRLNLNVVGSGIRMQSKLDSDILGMSKDVSNKLESVLEREFEKWTKAENCDVEGELNFYSMQSLAIIGMLISGDIFFNTIINEENIKLQSIESDRVTNPQNVFDTERIKRGVEFSKAGKRVAYHITEENPYSDNVGSSYKKYIWKRVPVYGAITKLRRIFHIYDKGSTGRPGMIRGVPLLHPILDSLRQLNKYTEAELTAAVVSGMFSVFVKTEGQGALPGTRKQTTDEEEKGEISLGNGAIVDLLPGEDISTANPGRPNTAYEPFVAAIIKEIGAAIGLPYEVLMLHFSSSYTAARGAILQAWSLYKYFRNSIIVRYFCQPIFELWVDYMVASGKINLPNYAKYRDVYFKTTWIGYNGGSIDPLKEVNAAEKRINIGVSTIQKEAEEITGLEWADVHRQRIIEVSKRKEDGVNVGVVEGKKDEILKVIEEERMQNEDK